MRKLEMAMAELPQYLKASTKSYHGNASWDLQNLRWESLALLPESASLLVRLGSRVEGRRAAVYDHVGVQVESARPFERPVDDANRAE